MLLKPLPKLFNREKVIHVKCKGDSPAPPPIGAGELPCPPDFQGYKIHPWIDPLLKKCRIMPIRQEMICLQIVPNRLITNDDVETLAKSLHGIRKPFMEKFRKLDKWLLVESDLFVIYEVLFHEKQIKFYFHVPRCWGDYAVQKMNSVWPRATVNVVDVPLLNLDSKKTKVNILTQVHHCFRSLSTNKTSLVPIPSILSTIDDVVEGDLALLQFCMEPLDKGWQRHAEEGYQFYNKGITIEKNMFDVRSLILRFTDSIASVLDGFAHVVVEIFSFSDQPLKPESERIKSKSLPRLSHATHQKQGKDAFSVSIRVAVQSENSDRRMTIAKSLTTAFKDMTQDNELEEHNVCNAERLISEITQRRRPLIRLYNNILSTEEVSRMLQQPTSSLQEEIPEITSKSFSEFELPEAVTKDGILIGTSSFRNKKHNVFWPTSDRNELVLLKVIVGGSRSGKSTYASNFAVESARKGWSVILVCVADGRSLQEVRQALGREYASRIINLDYGNEEFIIGLTHAAEASRVTRASNRVASEVLAFIERITQQQLPIRTRKWMKYAARVIFENPDNTFLELIKLLTDDMFRASVIPTIKNPTLKREWVRFHSFSAAKQSEIIDPILSRLDQVYDDEILKAILCQRPKRNEKGELLVDFRRWMDAGKIVLVHVPKAKLGAHATDTIMNIIIGKINLAALSRGVDMTLEERQAKPAFVLLDEPHQFLGSADQFKTMTVESAKYGLNLSFFIHSTEQIKAVNPSLLKILKAADAQYMFFRGSNDTWNEFAEKIEPTFNLRQCMMMPRKHAIVSMTLNGQPLSAFMVKTPAPAPVRYSQNVDLLLDLIESDSQLYGQRYEEIERDLYRREDSVNYDKYTEGAEDVETEGSVNTDGDFEFEMVQ